MVNMLERNTRYIALLQINLLAISHLGEISGYLSFSVKAFLFSFRKQAPRGQDSFCSCLVGAGFSSCRGVLLASDFGKVSMDDVMRRGLHVRIYFIYSCYVQGESGVYGSFLIHFMVAAHI